MHWGSVVWAWVSLTTRTGSFSSSARFAALRRRAPATTSYLLSSSSRTRRGARIPCVLKLAASSSRLFASKRLRGLVAAVTKPILQDLSSAERDESATGGLHPFIDALKNIQSKGELTGLLHCVP